MLAALLAQEIALPGCAPRVFNSIVTDNSTVIASVSEAIQSKPRMRSPSLGCFALPAMTGSCEHQGISWPPLTSMIWPMT